MISWTYIELVYKSCNNCWKWNCCNFYNNWYKTLCSDCYFKNWKNAKLSKLLNEGFKRSIYWNEYKVTPDKIIEIAAINDKKPIRELLDWSCQGVNRLFVLAYDNTEDNNQVSANSHKKYFLPRVKIDNYNTKLMVENLMINQLMIQLNKMMKLEKY